MKYAMLSAVAVAGLLLADSAAKAQIVVGGSVRGVGVTVGVGGGYYLPPPPPPVVYMPGPYAVPAPVMAPAPLVAPAVSVGVVGPGFYRPYYGYPRYGYAPGYYRPYYPYRR